MAASSSSDGSIWIVDATDRATSGPWVDAPSITIIDGSAGSYDLVDTDDRESVTANYIGQE